ncbi:MAG: DNA-binding protein [Nitrospirota bacterium]|nr:DNA-binding protein [Nitrospirota bacterium]
MKKKDLLTVEELAAELRVSLKSIQQASREGDMPVQSSRGSLVVAGYI